MDKTKENEESKENGESRENVLFLGKQLNENETKIDWENQTNSNHRKIIKPNIEMVPPDGGWGWMIVFGGFLTIVLGSFPLFSFSILYSPLLMSSGVSSSTTAWIYNIHGLVWSIYTMFIGPLCEEYGWRKISIIGGVANFLSIFLSAYVTKVELLFFTFSFFGGIGGSTGFIVCNFAVSRYFVKRRGFALAIVTLGSTVSSFFSPLLAHYLLENFGYKGASLIYGATVLNQCVGAALFQPVEWHMKPRKNDTIFNDSTNIGLLKEPTADKSNSESKKNSQINPKQNDSLDCTTKSFANDFKEKATILGNSNAQHSKSFWFQFIKIMKLSYTNLKTLHFLRVKLIAVGYACLFLGYLNFQMWIPFIITNAGYSLEVAAWCVSISSISNVIGRISMSFLSDRKWFIVRYGYMLGVFFIGISIIAFSLADTDKLFLICVCCWGLGVGISLSLNTNAMISIMGVKMLPALLGVSSLLKGLISIVVGPLIGFARDSTSSYTYAMSLLGGLELFGFCLWLLMPLAVRYDQKKIDKTIQCS